MAIRHASDLHSGRWSACNARYFVTLCTSHRRLGLESVVTTNAIIAAAANWDLLEDTSTLALTVMTDHLHWLFQLGDRLTLGRVVARFKAHTRSTLAATGGEWQRDFFEHRLREKERAEDYARYVFRNPDRAHLASDGERWKGWWAPRLELLEFWPHLNGDGSPPTQWLGEPTDSTLQVGE